MNRTLIPTAAFLAASLFVGPIGCDSDSDSGDSQGTGTDANDTDVSSTSGGSDSDGNDTEVGGTTLGPGEDSSSGDAPADCSCYDPAVDTVDIGQGCLERSDALPGCTFETAPCEPIEQAESKDGGPEGPPTPEGAVACVVEALAQGQTPPFVEGTSTYISGSTSTHTPREDGSYIRDTCWSFDSSAGQSVDVIVPADAEYFAACLADNAGDESSMYTCLFEGLTAQDDVFPACG